MSNTATFIGRTDEFGGNAAIFKLDPPFAFKKTFWRRRKVYTSKILVVEFTHYGIGGGPKTFIYPWDQGEFEFKDRLEQSLFNEWNCDKAIQKLGYEVNYE